MTFPVFLMWRRRQREHLSIPNDLKERKRQTFGRDMGFPVRTTAEASPVMEFLKEGANHPPHGGIYRALVLPGNLSGGVRPASGNPCLISLQNISDLAQNSIPYFRPDRYPISSA